MGGSESDKKPLGRPPGRKDAAKRVRRTEAEQQRDAAVTAGLVNALGGTQPPQKPEQLVLYGRERRTWVRGSSAVSKQAGHMSSK